MRRAQDKIVAGSVGGKEERRGERRLKNVTTIPPTTLFPPFSILLPLALPTPLYVAVRRGAERQSEGVLTAAADRIVPFLSVENPVDKFTKFFEWRED